MGKRKSMRHLFYKTYEYQGRKRRIQIHVVFTDNVKVFDSAPHAIELVGRLIDSKGWKRGVVQTCWRGSFDYVELVNMDQRRTLSTADKTGIILYQKGKPSYSRAVQEHANNSWVWVANKKTPYWRSVAYQPYPVGNQLYPVAI